MKRTSRGRSAGARDVTLEDDSLFIFAGFWIWTRDRGEQSSGVLVLRITVQVRRLRELHNAAEIHDRDPIADDGSTVLESRNVVAGGVHPKLVLVSELERAEDLTEVNVAEADLVDALFDLDREAYPFFGE